MAFIFFFDQLHVYEETLAKTNILESWNMVRYNPSLFYMDIIIYEKKDRDMNTL